ncbi:MAG: flagellar hook protein FlgE [Halocynthiibacter sp.]
MTISSSLNAGVSGLNANATRLATIADNIANSGTYGYKREEADFHSMVISGSDGLYSAGGVRTTTTRLIDQSGPLITSQNPTDIAVTGRGFIPATPVVSMKDGAQDRPFHLMTTGSFRPNEEGYLISESGMALMGWPMNPDGSVGNYPRDSVSALEPIQVGLNQYAGDPTTNMSLGLNLPAVETEAGSSGDPRALTLEYFGNLGTPESVKVEFTPTIPVTGYGNEWTMEIYDSASAGAKIAEFTLQFNDSQTLGGTLANVTAVSGGTYDAVTGDLSLSMAGGPITMGIGTYGHTGGISQLSSSFAPGAITKNGSPVGNMKSVKIDQNGFLHAVYDAGFTRRIYQVPLADVQNANGLETSSGQTYQISPESGSFFLWDAGGGPTGEIVGYAREESSTDVAAELTRMIQTQRAYSSNAKVIQTVDEMLQETTNIKR